jgi:mono/diheme cytochrome c family protein
MSTGDRFNSGSGDVTIWPVIACLRHPRLMSQGLPPRGRLELEGAIGVSRLPILGFWIGLIGGGALAGAQDSFEDSIRPLLNEYCITCHSTEKQEGEFDLERFASPATVKDAAVVWEAVLDQLAIREMPPKSAPQLSAEQTQRLMDWARQTLDEIAVDTAGDPGPVVLRRLSNMEYMYTLRDLTGIESLDPAREFPVDGAAGEGFTNAGAALVMSPALLIKYLDAAKEVSKHLVPLPDGIRFSPSDSSQDWTDETLTRIRVLYARHTGSGVGLQTVQQGIELDMGVGSGRLPLARYLDALQGRGGEDGLSRKFLNILRERLTSQTPSVLLDPLRAKFRAKQLSAADIEPWQQVLWRFTSVGHIGKVNGPKAWQEPVTPLVSQQELRAKLESGHDQTLYLVTGNAGDGDVGDEVLWENPRLVAKGRPDVPLANLPELMRHLQTQQAKILAGTEASLAAIASGGTDADPEVLAAWRDYLGLGEIKLEPLLLTKIEGTPDYKFIQGWTAGNDLSVLANSSDATVRIPGVMRAHSIATHPSPERAAVIAWLSPAAKRLRISGEVVHAHPECGNGVTWTLEVRRGNTTELLASGVSQGANSIPLGPFADVHVEPGQVVALSIGPRDGNHSCDMTAVNLTLNDGESNWDLAADVSPNILAGNPHGPWHFLSQPASQQAAAAQPAAIAAWCRSPSPENAREVRKYLEQEFPISSPLLAGAMRSFRPREESNDLKAKAPSVIELQIPAALAAESELVVTGKLASQTVGSVQMQVLTEKPIVTQGLVAGKSQSAQQKSQWSDNHLVTQHTAPIIVPDGSDTRKYFEAAFDEFRALFPIALCYTRIVPVDEVVTLTLYYREDEPLRRLILDDAEARELDRLWEQLLFVSEAPLKQVDAFEQLWQFATQDADPSAFEQLREPILLDAAKFREQQKAAEPAQRRAVVDFASKAWRRPLTPRETEELMRFPPRVMLVRVLTSPAFLYRIEKGLERTGPVSDWELATRLSYFLWSTAPDDELRSLAAAGRLRNPDVLAAQARRMLQDDKVRRLATEFGCQWLHVRDIAKLDEKSERHFPTFLDVRGDMQEEVTRFFIDLFQNDRSVVNLLDADYTFVNEALAGHYGLEVEGAGWRRIEGLHNRGRGGILGFSATLAKHAGASRTSAILRGTWLSEVVLGDKLPNPPKGVPVLPEEAPEGLTERQLIERHSSDPNCSSCHQRIDPYGFALEGFDAIGRARPADVKTVLHDGTAVEGLAGLRDYLVHQRRQDFLGQFSRKLLGYALGRSVQLSDRPLIDAMVRSEGNHVADVVELIVRSPQFRDARGQDALVKSEAP